MPALPSPGAVVRVQMVWEITGGHEFGSRFFLSYTGGPPSSTDLNNLCANVEGHFNGEFLSHITTEKVLIEVNAVDLSSDTGATGQWTGSVAGTDGSTSLPSDVCTNVGFVINRRYRGGRPKIFLPTGSNADLASTDTWSSTYVAAINTAWGSFMGSVLADTYGSFTLSDNCNVSFYQGFTVFTGPTGRASNRPTPRTTPKVDNIINHECKQEIASQRRRRASVSP